MKNFNIFLILFIFSQASFSQALYKTINSTKLAAVRELKIQLPRNYEKNSDKKYPLIIVLDGEYLFEPMAGTVDLYSYWDEIPEAIVVGINQAETREDDCSFDTTRFLPAKKGAQFFEFLGMELLPYLDREYRTSKFVALAGHDITANFINYYLFKPNPLFQAYINLSPEYAPEMVPRLAESMHKTQTPYWYYLATASNDIPELKKDILQANSQFTLVENGNFKFLFQEQKAANHYTLISKALPDALEHIFSSYRPIGLKEYDEIVMMDDSAYDYLVQKYDRIDEYFGIGKTVRINDFLAVGKALEFVQKWDDLEKLGDLAQKQYPHTSMGNYFLARSYEANGNPKKAMKTYQSAYGLEEIAFITVDFMLKKAEVIKEDFGY